MIASGSPRLAFRIAIAAMIAAVTSTIRTMIGTMSCPPPSPAVLRRTYRKMLVPA